MDILAGFVFSRHFLVFSFMTSPPIFGLDLSPILAFFLLNVLTNATAALGAELTPEMKKTLERKSYTPLIVKHYKTSTGAIQKPAMFTLGEL